MNGETADVASGVHFDFAAVEADPTPTPVSGMARCRSAAQVVIETDEGVRSEVDEIIGTQAWPGLIKWVKGFGDKRGGWSATTGKLTGLEMTSGSEPPPTLAASGGTTTKKSSTTSARRTKTTMTSTGTQAA